MITAEVLVSAIDLNDPWFADDLGERTALPGEHRIDSEANVLSRRQITMIIRGLQENVVTAAMQLGEACDYARGRNMANMRGRQHDFNIADYFANLANQNQVDEPLTAGQKALVDTQVKALLGTEPHFRPEVQAAINKLSAEKREYFVDRFESCRTRGELSEVLAQYERRVPNPARLRGATQTAAQEAVAGVDLDNPVEEDDSF